MIARAAAWAAIFLAFAATGAAACDRTCLRSALDGYLTAVIAHDPDGAALAKSHRETENANEIVPGDGMWTSATALGQVQRRYLDPKSGQAAYFGTMEEGGAPVIVSLRIKMEGRKIAEAEWIIARKGEALLNVANLAAEPPPEAIAPKAGRPSRAQLAAAANSYFDGLQGHDGTFVAHNPGCIRLENGTRVTGRRAPPPGSAAVEFDAGDCAANLDRMTQIEVRRASPLSADRRGGGRRARHGDVPATARRRQARGPLVVAALAAGGIFPDGRRQDQRHLRGHALSARRCAGGPGWPDAK